MLPYWGYLGQQLTAPADPFGPLTGPPAAAFGGDWAGYEPQVPRLANPPADPRAVYALTGGRWGVPAGPFDPLGAGLRRFWDGYGQSLNDLWQMYLSR